MTLRDVPKLHPVRTLALIVGGGGLLVGLLALLLPHDIEQTFGLPALFHLRGPVAPPNDVVIVALEQDSARRLSLPAGYYRWPREHHARLIDNLRRAGASLVVFDVTFSPSALQSPAGTAALVAATAQAGNVLFASSLDSLTHELTDEASMSAIAELQPHDDTAPGAATIRQCRQPEPALTAAARGVAPFVLPPQAQRADIFWVYNTSPCNAPTLPALALQLHARDAWPAFMRLLADATNQRQERLQTLSPDDASTTLTLRQRFRDDPTLAARIDAALTRQRHAATIDDRQYRRVRALVGLYGGEEARYLNPFGPALSFPTIAFADAVAAHKDPAQWASFREKVAGRVVFIGASELTLEDQKNSTDAFNTVYDEPQGLRLQGVELLATAFVNLLEARDLKRAGTVFNLLLMSGECLLLVLICYMLSLPRAAAAAGLVIVAYLVFCANRFAAAAVWLPIVTPAAVAVVSMPLAWLARYIDLLRERRDIVRALQRRLPPGVAREFLRTGHVNRTVQGVCLSSDLGNWTRLATQVPEAELGESMQRYLSSLFECAEQHGGYPVDSAGDGMLAIWVDGDDSALERRRRASQAALQVLRIGAEQLRIAGQALPTRIGLCQGDLALRDVGGDHQFQVKPFGRTVNITSRLESLNKRLGTQILATAEVAVGLDEFVWRPLGRFLVDGIDTPIDIVELMASQDGASGRNARIVERFTHALTHYEARRFDDAVTTLRQIVEIFPADGPAAFYLEHIAEARSAVADPNWSSAIRLDKEGTKMMRTGDHG